MKFIRGQRFLPEETGRLEDRIPKLINNEVNFGTEDENGNLSGFLVADNRKGSAKTIQSDHPFSASQYLFDGFNDLERIYGLPLMLYQAMNTSEIVALFVGDAVMKKFPDIQFHGRSYNQLKQQGNVEEIVSAMVSVGYSYHAVRRVIGRGYSSHPTGSGDLMRRIAALPEVIKIKLREALVGQRAVPNRENPKTFDYDDLNITGRMFGYHTPGSASVYIGSFFRGMKSVYAKHHKK